MTDKKQLPPTKAYCKRAGLCVIEVCSSLFIFITLDRTKVLICPPATSQTLPPIPPTPQKLISPANERALEKQDFSIFDLLFARPILELLLRVRAQFWLRCLR